MTDTAVEKDIILNVDEDKELDKNSDNEDFARKEDTQADMSKKIRVAVAGCAHGEMDKIYAVLAEIEREKGYKFDLLICCGDYQAVRNYGDLHHMHVSEKYRSLQTFYKYYSGEKVAPVLTIFVGGNHEASGYLCELPNGGWVAPNIYYMGFANVIRFGGLRIAGLSGIFNAREFHRGHYECPPYSDQSEVVSSYHVRSIDVWRLKQLRPADGDYTSNPIDIMVTHDWPAGIVDYGDKNWLLRVKPFFRNDVVCGKLGNPSTMKLLFDIRPRYWLSAHLHVAFAALVPHTGKDGSGGTAPTRFLALDKPIPRRHFIQSLEMDVAVDAEMKLSYDPQWLAILKITDRFTSISPANVHLPSSSSSDERWDFRPTNRELASISDFGDLIVPENFRQTAPPLQEDTPKSRSAKSTSYYRNPQSAEFCSRLGISDINKMLAERDRDNVAIAHYILEANKTDSNEIVIDNDIFADDEDFVVDTRPTLTNLDDFVPPKIMPKTNMETEDKEDSVVLKRRKVDIPDGD